MLGIYACMRARYRTDAMSLPVQAHAITSNGNVHMSCERRVVWVIAALAVALTACTAEFPRTIEAAVVPADSPIGVWEYPASEFPTMCIVLLPHGELRFQGGFLFFNPGRWEKNPRDGTLRMTLGGASPFPFGAPRRHSSYAAGTVVTAIPDQRVLVYQLTPNSASLEFAGFVFYRKATCAAE